MKRLSKVIPLLVVAATLFSACTPKATPPPETSVPANISTEVPATSEISVTEAPTLPPTLVPVIVTPPPMELGSSFLYADGTIILAVPAGEFTMGKKGGTDNPEHKVTLSDYWISSTETTNDQYRNCVAAGQCTEPNLFDNQGYNDFARTGEPVTGVTWDQASDYCTFIHGRLPSEAEWEKAGRGPDANIYPWGEDLPICSLLNFNDCVAKTTQVSKYPEGKSYYGLFDMAGNVYEWVNDRYDPYYYKNGPVENPGGPETGETRVYRSSAYNSNNEQVPLSVRYYAAPDTHDRSLGFRCVVEDPLYFAPYCQTVMVTGVSADGQPIPGGESKLTCSAFALLNPVPLCNQDNNTPYTTIDIPPDIAQYVTDFGGCVLDNGNTYVCYSETNITIDIAPSCSVSQPNPPSCPMGYQQNGNVCEPTQGWVGQCMPGQNFDPVNQCCTGASGSGNPLNLEPYCGAGFSYNPQTQTCDPFNYPPVESIHIPINGCEPKGNDNPGDDPNDPGNPGDPGGCPPGTVKVGTNPDGSPVCRPSTSP